MTITFPCPQCGREIRVRDEAVGKTGQCRDCKSSLVVPSPTQIAAAEPLRTRKIAEKQIRRPPTELIRNPPRPDEPGRPAQSAVSRVPDEFEVAEMPRQSPQPRHEPQPQAPQYGAPPTIVVNVSQHAQATAIAVAGAGYTNVWAVSALLVAFAALLCSWVPFVGMLAFPAVGLAFLLAAIGFLASLFHGGRGLLTSVGAVCISFAAVGMALFSTGAAATAIAKKAADDAKAIEVRRAVPLPAPAASQPAPARAAAPPVVPVAMPAIEEKAPITVKPAQIAPPEPTSGERDAAAKKRFGGVLTNGKNLAKVGILAGAEKAFRRIIDGAPGTPIAADAQKELDALPVH
jgi:hypothetical protein